jgi:hypothetical protein
MITRLQVGHVEEGGEKISDNKLTKKALLVYEGTFQSMDGEVTLKAEDLAEIATNHNSGLERLKRLFGGGPKVQVPLQLDHSAKSTDTIGRVEGPVTMGTFKDEDGTEKAALYGQLMFIGKENVEKAEDGRYTHLSVGLDKNKKLTEVSVTPFPAAPHASLLSKPGTGDETMSMSVYHKYKKARKHLKKHLGMSEEDADKKLESAKPEEVEKMAADHDEHEEKMAKMAAEEEKDSDKKELAKYKAIVESIKKDEEAVRLASKKLNLSIRLSGLVAQGKLTPAEMKKVDLVKLSQASDDAVDEVVKSYENRQPVVPMGQVGSTKAADPSKVAAELKRLRKIQLEAETKNNMPFTGAALANIDKERRRLQGDGGSMPKGNNEEHMAENIGGHMPGGPGNEGQMADKPAGVREPGTYDGMDKDHEHLAKLLEEGKHDEAKMHLKAMREKMKAHMAEHGGEEPPAHMAAVKQNMNELKLAHKSLRAKLDLVTH